MINEEVPTNTELMVFQEKIEKRILNSWNKIKEAKDLQEIWEFSKERCGTPCCTERDILQMDIENVKDKIRYHKNIINTALACYLRFVVIIPNSWRKYL